MEMRQQEKSNKRLHCDKLYRSQPLHIP